MLNCFLQFRISPTKVLVEDICTLACAIPKLVLLATFFLEEKTIQL